MKGQSPQRPRPSVARKPGHTIAADRRHGWWERFKAALPMSANGASLAVFRICLGLVMTLEAWSLVRPDVAAISSGRTPLDTYYTGADINFHFPFPLFSWLPLFPPAVIHALVLIQAVAGLLMAAGLFYRVAATAVFLSWGYLWVVESTRTYWQSHYYLETLLTFLMIWMPAARRYSLDAWRARKRNAPFPDTVPLWTVLLLRGQLLIAYFYAGVAKLNIDWLADAMPVRWFIAQPHVTAPYERFLGADQIAAFKRLMLTPEVAYFLSYTGLVFDLVIGFLLLARRTRIFGLILMLIFHSTNHLLIFDDIGWFPLVGLLTALIFLDPDWPERFWNWLKRPRITNPDWKYMKWFVEGGLSVMEASPAKAVKSRAGEDPLAPLAPERIGRWVLPFVVAWLGWQTLMPIRHYFIQGDGRFTYEGLSMSWRLKSEVRRAVAAQIYITDPNIISGGQINWREWKGDKVIYRTVTPGRIDWRTMPEMVAVVEPGAGERVIYNPYRSNTADEAGARDRATRIWTELYGRAPTLGLAPAAIAETLRTTGIVSSASAPFLFVEDTILIPRDNKLSRISREHWKSGQYTRSPNRPNRSIGADPLVLHLSSIGPELRSLVPSACVFDSQDQPGNAPYIYWNGVSDLTVSKVMHMSYQAFYLRRYARRVADLWQAQYARRPVVQAITAVSLNGRPPQQLVDPAADLASVSARWFSHNPWIRQLETHRIPKEAVENPPVL